MERILERSDLPVNEKLLPLVTSDRSITHSGFDTIAAAKIIKSLIRAGANQNAVIDGHTVFEMICRNAAKPAPLLGAFDYVKTDEYLFHELCRNRSIKQKDQLRNSIDHLIRILGNGAKSQAQRLDSENNSVYHLIATSAACSREAVLLLKGLINDQEIINQLSNRGFTAYQILQDNKLLDSSSREKCMRLLKPTAVKNEKLNDIDDKLKSLVQLRENLLETRDREKSIYDDFELPSRRRRVVKHLKFDVDWIETEIRCSESKRCEPRLTVPFKLDRIATNAEIRQSGRQRHSAQVSLGCQIVWFHLL